MLVDQRGLKRYAFALLFFYKSSNARTGGKATVNNMSEVKNIKISEALGDYLEAIYLLSHQCSAVRITDIALRLGISKPSVNRAVNTLKNQGLVLHRPYGDIVLTEKGRSVASEIHIRHNMIKKFLINVLNLGGEEAEKEAARMEHNISQSTIDKMISFMEQPA